MKNKNTEPKQKIDSIKNNSQNEESQFHKIISQPKLSQDKHSDKNNSINKPPKSKIGRPKNNIKRKRSQKKKLESSFSEGSDDNSSFLKNNEANNEKRE